MHACKLGKTAKPVGKERQNTIYNACLGRGYHVLHAVLVLRLHGPSVAWSEQTHRSGTTRKRKNYRSGVYCAARQRPIRRFTVLAWRHSVMLASC